MMDIAIPANEDAKTEQHHAAEEQGGTACAGNTLAQEISKESSDYLSNRSSNPDVFKTPIERRSRNDIATEEGEKQAGQEQGKAARRPPDSSNQFPQ